jgi:hypothetical protein
MVAADLVLIKIAKAKSKGRRSCIGAALSATGLKNKWRREGLLTDKKRPELGFLNGTAASETLKLYYLA